ncbi:Vacuolar protein sorting-associated protein 18-like protein [Aphelenchoides bicaudatus]|nr:Vacuolar protein sorting-associated protein 18-like protein [Aphelenchoides bicaudatus]
MLLETVINSDGQQIYVKTLVKSFVQGKELPVNSIHMGSSSLDSDTNWVVIVCIPGQLYCVNGTLNLNALNTQPSQPLVGNMWSAAMIDTQQPAVLSSFFNNRNLLKSHSTSSTQTDAPNNFCLFPILSDSYGLPEKYAWLNPDGISAGTILIGKSDGYEMIKQDWHVAHKLVEGIYKYPINICLSEYHIAVLHSDRLSSHFFGSKAIGITRDFTSQFIWVYAETSIFNFRPVNEARDVWRILLEKKDFVAAQKITKVMTDPRPYQIVIKKVAANYLSQQKFVEAAELLAKSDEPFENTVMKFLKFNSRESRNGLKSYLDLRLSSPSKPSRVQRDILIIWLLEIQLSELAELRRNAAGNEPTNDETSGNFSFAQKGNQIKRLREELFRFLDRHIVTESISENRLAIYRLITTHVDFETQLHVAAKLKDYDVLVKVYLLQKDYTKALEIISSQASSALFYTYAEDLFENKPREFVVALINAGRLVRPGQIVSIFFNCQSSMEKVAAAFVYLNHAISKELADQATHDFLIKLFAETRPNSLLEHLKKFGKNKRKVPYSISKALSICIEKKLTECCVFLYCLLEMYETAVKLALTVRVELAKECAIELNQSFSGDPVDFLSGDIDFIEASQRDSSMTVEAKKHVWIEIAKHMIRENYNIFQCMELLKESNNVIKIQDILSFFPEFTKIEYFKQPLCDCLKEHALKIQELQKEMSYVSESATQIQSHIEKAKSNVTVVKAGEKCNHCSHQLLSKPFFIFNCRHFLHYDCTIEYLRQCFTAEESDLLNNLLKSERTLQAEILIKSGKEKSDSEAELVKLRREIKEFVAAECPMCGHDRLTSLLAKPIVSEQAYQKLSNEWAL